MSKTNNPTKYEEMKNTHYPIDKIVEQCVEYFGEEFRSTIEQANNKTKPVFVTSNLAEFKIRQAFETFYKDKPSVDWEREAELCCSNLKALASNQVIFSELMLAKHSLVLTTLGFDFSKILLHNKQTNMLQINDKSAETEKLKNFVNYSVEQKTTVELPKIEANNIVEAYNEMLEEIGKKTTANNKPYQSEDYHIGISKNKNGIYDFKIHNDKDLLHFPETENIYPTINIADLKKADKEFLISIIQAKDVLSLRDKEYQKYFIKGINRIFGKQFNNLEELMGDEQMKPFLDFINKCGVALDKCYKKDTLAQIGLIENDNYTTAFMLGERHFERSPNCGGAFDKSNNAIYLPMDRGIDEHVVTHEFLHAVGNEKGDFPSTGLDEVVNEYLTLKVMKKEMDFSSSYHLGIVWMQSFLDTFEEELKLSKMGDAKQSLREFIGFSNYLTLIEYGNFLESIRYGLQTVTLTFANGQEAFTMDEWLEEYYRDPAGLEEVTSKEDLAKFEKMIHYQDFMKKLVANYEKFKNHEKVRIELNTESKFTKTREVSMSYGVESN